MRATVVSGPLRGNEVEGAPEHAAGFSLLYRAPFGLTINPRARYIGETFQDVSNEAVQDAHWLLDFYASYQVLKHLQVFLGVTNVFDEEYIADGLGQTLGAPRQV
jgi:outer membrane receptor protein involved in Fe transport